MATPCKEHRLSAEQRREISRRNAQQSTGPRTPEGKAASRQNALKHGLTSTALDRDTDPYRDRMAS